jgi:hypothetical protein
MSKRSIEDPTTKNILILGIGIFLILIAISKILDIPLIESILFLIGGVLCIYGVYNIEKNYSKKRK